MAQQQLRPSSNATRHVGSEGYGDALYAGRKDTGPTSSTKLVLLVGQASFNVLLMLLTRLLEQDEVKVAIRCLKEKQAKALRTEEDLAYVAELDDDDGDHEADDQDLDEDESDQ